MGPILSGPNFTPKSYKEPMHPIGADLYLTSLEKGGILVPPPPHNQNFYKFKHLEPYPTQGEKDVEGINQKFGFIPF
jgi:hypothetical protein